MGREGEGEGGEGVFLRHRLGEGGRGGAADGGRVLSPGEGD
jgi:hypothetical protein